jgi:nicotinamide-nucleotide amidase
MGHIQHSGHAPAGHHQRFKKEEISVRYHQRHLRLTFSIEPENEQKMNAEIVTIGTELLLGEIVDTNAAHIARQLRTIGLNLYYKTTVGDNEARCAAVIQRALERAEAIITTGGLGPTVDDVTREAVAQATGRPLEFRADLLAQIEARFNRWGSHMSENNRRQAFIPQGAIPIENPVGTAPCFIVETDRGVVISLPGVPREMKYLLEHTVLPYLRQRFELRSIIKARIIRTAALGESRIDTALRDLLTAENPTIGLSAHPGQTDVRITAKAENEEQADALIAPVEEKVRQRLGEAVYGTGKETVEEVLVRHLTEAGMTLATAESGTGGMLTNRLSTAPNPEPIFRGGFVSTDPFNLGKALGIQLEDDSQKGLEAFAGRLATQLKTTAEGCPTESCLGLVVLTLPRSSGEAATAAGGTIIALATPDAIERRNLGYGGHADYVATWATTNALELTRRWLLKRRR